MLRVRYHDSFRTRSYPFFVQNIHRDISPPLWYFPLVRYQLDHPVELPEHGRVMVQPKYEEFDWEFIIWSHRLRVRYRPQGYSYLLFPCRLNPESVCDRSQGESFDDVEPRFAIFGVQKGAGKPRPPSEYIPGSRSIISSSSRMYWELIFCVYFMLRAMRRWKSPL